ncbi:MAG TPA: lysine--tRNA ligase [Patescibacteria group bacterium]|nr:lysine--tRNA ligase [Patescibacteria group bacterium]
MFWADKVAEEIIKSGKYKPYWVDDMKTPSGRIHVGALRGVIIHDLVYKALKEKGVKVEFTYIFEDHDPMDDIPSYLSREKYEKYLGMPLFKIPAPVKGLKNYAEYFALEFQDVFNKMGCNPKILWTKDLYTSGKMNPVIKEILDNAKEVRKIYEEMYKKEILDNWYPFQLYCPSCEKVSTVSVTDWDGKEVTYECEINKVKWTRGCGKKGKASPFSTDKEMVGKLPWKVEWPAKWKAVGITVEGAGKDHMSAGGSHDLAKLICKRVINYPVPYPIAYEWLLIGGKKMSSSKGVGASAKDVLEILPPELARFLMVKIKINQQVNFDPSEKDTIPVLFDEYQKAADAYFDKSNDDLARVFEMSQIGDIRIPPKIRFATLTQWVQMPNMEEEIKKEGLTQWAKYAKTWLNKYAPESMKFTVCKKLPEDAKNLSKEQKEFLNKLAIGIDKNWDAEEFQEKLYEWAKELDISSKEAFSAIYISLLNKNHGPKAGWLILSLDRKFIINRFREVR